MIRSYFTDRKQYVYVDGYESRSREMNVGVIQVGILASLLFIIYINDIAMFKLRGRLFTYADDTYIAYDKFDPLEMQADLNGIGDYFSINRLTINAKKTELIQIKSTHKTTPDDATTLHINNDEVKQISKVRYLGLEIDSCMTWKAHIDNLATELSRPVGMLHKLKYRLDTGTLKTIYNSLIGSKLQYMLSVYGGAKDVNLKRLCVLQNRAMKSIYKLPALYNTIALYAETAKGTLPLRCLYQKKLIVLAYQTL